MEQKMFRKEISHCEKKRGAIVLLEKSSFFGLSDFKKNVISVAIS